MQNILIENKKQLMIGICIALALIIGGLARGLTREQPSSQSPAPLPQNSAQLTEKNIVRPTETIEEKLAAERREKARKAIAEHEEAIKLHWGAEDTPDRMMAMGNLHQYQLSDYYSAIECYRNLVDNFSDHDKVAQAYVEIATCYEKVGDQAQARFIYQEMVDSLDSSLQHVQYAKLKLGKD
ncbi:MAG: hypothetical protein C4520_05680 [Candidatus Abyssobacteria bacterium SURF_5]|uniref:Tetratricopeptide repeat protein n=1 Tax=Abyssobacteria bacterium (strain SURF_5) TaxID=2093360 RepID=A0A3A4P783_ABYX5|nr:MAG: hypothetical protein C4520_05680 [Candidatus Abyssubacteria bacterium SURF_5]